jgi:protein subunit release factor A
VVQDQRSQHMNKAAALKVLAARVADAERCALVKMLPVRSLQDVWSAARSLLQAHASFRHLPKGRPLYAGFALPPRTELCCRVKAQAQQSEQRRLLVGSGDRSERIRTYNFQENRITDHRINLTLFGVEDMLAGAKLEELIASLRRQDQMDRITILAEEEGP